MCFNYWFHFDIVSCHPCIRTTTVVHGIVENTKNRNSSFFEGFHQKSHGIHSYSSLWTSGCFLNTSKHFLIRFRTDLRSQNRRDLQNMDFARDFHWNPIKILLKSLCSPYKRNAKDFQNCTFVWIFNKLVFRDRMHPERIQIDLYHH